MTDLEAKAARFAAVLARALAPELARANALMAQLVTANDASERAALLSELGKALSELTTFAAHCGYEVRRQERLG